VSPKLKRETCKRLTLPCYSDLFKEAKRLQQLLEPKSKFHLGHNVQQLEMHVRQVESLFASVNQMRGGKTQELRVDLDIAIKGILTLRRPQKKQKPELNIEDL
jgi:hypothetical protein